MASLSLPRLIESGRSALCRDVLASLPEWFGRAAAVDGYASASDRWPMWASFADSGQAAGFLSLKGQTAAAAEVMVIAVRPEHHRAGVGRSLIAAAEAHARHSGMRFLTVKTVAPSHPDPNYAETRRFYDAMDFHPVETFPTLWGEDIPCLLMARILRAP